MRETGPHRTRFSPIFDAFGDNLPNWTEFFFLEALANAHAFKYDAVTGLEEPFSPCLLARSIHFV